MESGELRVERRLVDANYLVNKIIPNCSIEEGGIQLVDFDKHQKILALYPTVDALEVVRCFECQKEGTEDCPMVYKDELTGCLCANTKGMDFCSYGERRTDNGR